MPQRLVDNSTALQQTFIFYKTAAVISPMRCSTTVYKNLHHFQDYSHPDDQTTRPNVSPCLKLLTDNMFL